MDGSGDVRYNGSKGEAKGVGRMEDLDEIRLLSKQEAALADKVLFAYYRKT